jgi:hypothetical protein
VLEQQLMTGHNGVAADVVLSTSEIPPVEEAPPVFDLSSTDTAAVAPATQPDAAPRERDNGAYVAVLAPAMLRGATGGATRGGFSLHGCAALAAVLAFPPTACRQFADSVAAISPEEATAAACDSAASRALEAMLRGGAPAGLKRKLLLSLQALVLVDKPYFNEAGWAGQAGSDEGERNSRLYNEQVRLVMLRTAVAALRAPPRHVAALLRAHYAAQGDAIVAAAQAEVEGGAAAPGGDAPSEGYRASLRRLLPAVRAAFAALKDAQP